jgi:hypothetical protein
MVDPVGQSGTVHRDQTATGIGSMTGEVIVCRSCCDMMTRRNGSTPRRHRPRSAASSAIIAVTGCSWSKVFTTTSGHRRRSVSCTPTGDPLVPSIQLISDEAGICRGIIEINLPGVLASGDRMTTELARLSPISAARKY